MSDPSPDPSPDSILDEASRRARNLTVVERIYDSFGLPMTAAAADRMKTFIADDPKDRHGIHLYSPDQYGVEPERIRESFRRYMNRFELESEPL